MPYYEYVCSGCRHRFTVRRTISQYGMKSKIMCPKCSGKEVKRIYSAFTAVTSKKS